MPLQVDLERLRLGEGPTPVRELTRLGDERGSAPVWIKDDGAYSRLRRQQGAKARVAARRRPPPRQAHDPHRRGAGHQPRPGHARCSPAGSGCGPCSCWCLSRRREHVRRQLERMRAERRRAPSGRAGVARAYALAASLMLAARQPAREPPLLPAPRGIRAAGLRRLRRGGDRALRAGRGRRAAGALARRRPPRQRRHRRRAARRPEARRACARASSACWSTT